MMMYSILLRLKYLPDPLQYEILKYLTVQEVISLWTDHPFILQLYRLNPYLKLPEDELKCHFIGLVVDNNIIEINNVLLYGFNPNYYDECKYGAPEISRNPLLAAIHHKHVAIVSLLLQYGASPNDVYVKQYSPPLYHTLGVSCREHQEIMELLLIAGASLNETSGGNSPLLAATLGDDGETITFLLKYGADPSFRLKSTRREYFLTHTILMGYESSVNSLLQYNFSQDVIDQSIQEVLESPLHRYDTSKIGRILRRMGVDKDRLNRVGL